MSANPASPRPAEVRAAREAVQAALGIGITAAQDWCADKIHTKRRPWQQWESGDRAMHPAFWELFRSKTDYIIHAAACLDQGNLQAQQNAGRRKPGFGFVDWGGECP